MTSGKFRCSGDRNRNRNRIDGSKTASKRFCSLEWMGSLMGSLADWGSCFIVWPCGWTLGRMGCGLCIGLAEPKDAKHRSTEAPKLRAQGRHTTYLPHIYHIYHVHLHSAHCRSANFQPCQVSRFAYFGSYREDE